MSPIVAVVFLFSTAALAATTPINLPNEAAQEFWERTLPNSAIPTAIAQMMKKGTPTRADYGTNQQSLSCLFHYSSEKCNGSPPSAPTAVVGLFFRERDIKVGKVMTVAMPSLVPKGFLPDEYAKKLPFGNFRNTIAKFNISPTSNEAKDIRNTLLDCADRPVVGEQKSCATSLQAIVETAMGFLQTREVSVVASALTDAGLPHRAYMVRSVRQLGSSRFVACHNKPYPYALYLCHRTTRSQAYMIIIQGSFRGDQRISMVAVCHRDTRNWTPSHPAFKALGEHPGGEAVCHFSPYGDLLFVEKVAHG